MSYSIYDSKGFVADIASSGGWSDFRSWVETQDAGEETKQFFSAGWSDEPETLAKELQALKAGDADIESVRKAITDAAAKASDVVILRDSAESED